MWKSLALNIKHAIMTLMVFRVPSTDERALSCQSYVSLNCRKGSCQSEANFSVVLGNKHLKVRFVTAADPWSVWSLLVFVGVVLTMILLLLLCAWEQEVLPVCRCNSRSVGLWAEMKLMSVFWLWVIVSRDAHTQLCPDMSLSDCTLSSTADTHWYPINMIDSPTFAIEWKLLIQVWFTFVM